MFGFIPNLSAFLDETKANAGDYPPLEYVVDCTLGYPKGEVCDLGQAMLGEWPEGNNSSVAVHYKIHKIQPEWQDEKKLKAWLYERYEEKASPLTHKEDATFTCRINCWRTSIHVERLLVSVVSPVFR